jgi:integrase
MTSAQIGRIARGPEERRKWVPFIDRPDASPPRDRVLTEAEIVRFWHACDKVGEPIGKVLKLLLLTGCRRTELAGMRCDELGDDGDRLARSIGDLQDIVRTNRGGQGRLAEPPAADDPVAQMQPHRRQGAEA